MKYCDYLQSRFVACQVALERKQTTTGHAENHAILAHMWIALKIGTIFHMFVLLGHWLGVALRLIEAPKPAREIATAAAQEKMKLAEANRAITEAALKDAGVQPDAQAPRGGEATQ